MPQKPEKIVLGMISAKVEEDMKSFRIHAKAKRTIVISQKKPKPTISLVVVSYNRKDDLRKCLKSIYRQGVRADEVIVVDNNSTKGVIEMIKTEFPEVKLFALTDNRGLCYAANVGFKNSRSDYVGIVESDMALSGNWTEEVIKELQSNQDTGIACPKFLHRSKYGYINCEYERPDNELLMTNGCFAIRKAIIEENSGDLYDPKYFLYASEEELSARVFWLGFKIRRVPEARTFHNPSVYDAMLPESVRQRYNTRNNLWNLWRFYGMRNVILFTPIYMVKFLAEIRNPIRYTRIMIETFMGIGDCMRKRRSVKMETYKSFWKHFAYRRDVRRSHYFFNWKDGSIDPRYLLRLDGIEKLKEVTA